MVHRVCWTVDGDQSPDRASNHRSKSSPKVLGAATGFGDGLSATNAASAFSASRFVPWNVRDFESFLPVSSSRPA